MKNNDEQERARFDKWFLQEFPEVTRQIERGNDVALIAASTAWHAWLASRQSIEIDIDWPEANDDYWKDGEEGAYARGHEDGKDKAALAVRKALAEAGIKVNL